MKEVKIGDLVSLKIEKQGRWVTIAGRVRGTREHWTNPDVQLVLVDCLDEWIPLDEYAEIWSEN